MLTVEVERNHETALDQAVVRLQHRELQEVRHLHAMHGVFHLHDLGFAVTITCARKRLPETPLLRLTMPKTRAIRALKALRGRRRVTNSICGHTLRTT